MERVFIISISVTQGLVYPEIEIILRFLSHLLRQKLLKALLILTNQSKPTQTICSHSGDCSIYCPFCHHLLFYLLPFLSSSIVLSIVLFVIIYCSIYCSFSHHLLFYLVFFLSSSIVLSSVLSSVISMVLFVIIYCSI